ncbi:MAG: LytR family transcriptional regulator [Actinomycetota bacterium]|nr:MAG: LytR family transcriptional regulator [Actinomycetota bacterium]
MRPASQDPTRWARRLTAGGASLALVVALASGFAFARYLEVRDVGQRPGILDDPVVPSGSPAAPAGRCAVEACNYLILGSDSRAGLSPEEQKRFGTNADIGGETRADTIMLVHLNPELEKAIILSFPRDLWVRIPAHRGRPAHWDKINAAFEGGIGGGGPRLMAETVADLTGLRIDHVLYVDLAGFQQIVDTLGGVELCLPGYLADPATGRIQDPLTGLDVAPGCQRLDGAQALGYVRTRHLRCDLIPDFSRIGRQQQFLRAVINQMLRPENLVRAPSLIEPILGNMTRDARFQTGDLIHLVGELRGISTGDAEFRAVPGTAALATGPEGQQLSIVRMDPAAREIFSAIREGRPIGGVGERLVNTPPSEANVDVVVVDRGAADRVGEVVDLLATAGFAVEPRPVTGVGVALPRRSAIVYRPGAEAEAQVLRRYLPQLALREAPRLEGLDAAVVVGGDYRPPAPDEPASMDCPSA